MLKKMLLSVAVMVTAVSLADEFKAGFARVDITPPLGSFMPGYYKDRRAKSVLDPLEINMVAFSRGDSSALVAQVDTEALSDCVADRMRDAVVKATGVARDAILLHASHTHDGAYLARRSLDRSAAEEAGRATEIDDTYLDLVVTRVADAAVAALADLKPAKLSCGRGVAKRISFGRRYLMKDGRVATNPGTNNPDIVRPVGTPPDEQVQVLRIDCEGTKPICVINFQTHPDTVGGETITADWPGLARKVFEAATFGNSRCIVLNGTQGDVNHCNVMPKPGELNGLRPDFDSVDRGYEHAWHMANVLAGAALGVWVKCAPLEAGEIRFGVEAVTVPANRAKATDEKNLAWANDVWALHEKSEKEGLAGGKNDYVTRKYGWKGMELTTEVARAGRIRHMEKFEGEHVLPLDTVVIGKSVAFSSFPGEPFNDIGKAIKAKSPFALTMCMCLTNGSRGYFPFSDSYKEGGYESATSPFGPSVADDLIAGELRLLNRLAR